MHIQRTTLRSKPHIKPYLFAKDRDQRFVAIYKDAIGYGDTPKVAFIHMMNDLFWKSHNYTGNI